MTAVRRNKQQELQERMDHLGIREEDIEEHFIRAGGRGGQKTNKTAVCVYLKHLPTGIEVKCQRERSQAVNRFLARRILTEKIERRRRGARSREQARIAKIRRQKRKRSARTKAKLRKIKEERSEKKRLRRPPPGPGE
ncbi:MAG: peptide chain release factor-like protein [Candidatus Omnitrophica bacterium]|nr:peptide chain release factor-like protein [Candidatus Omnitrophota bacterium]